ncbi:MAG: hypothetical protein PHP50_06820 [Lachnospiraceae bacterium]|nr:hypothetical protein [Lachnospiraceae bacterium]
MFVGNYVGTERSKNAQLYILHSNVSYGADQSNIPVVDVGRRASQNYGEYRSSCHILYDNDVEDLSTGAKTAAYMSERVTQTKETLAAANNNLYTGSYHVSAEAISLFDQAYQADYPYGDGRTMPMFVYKPENGTVQEVIDSLTEIMTNAAGTPASTMGILNVTTKKKLVDTATGAETEGDASKSSILAQKVNNKWQYAYQNYDGVTNDGKMSYTELTFTYSWSDNDSITHTQVYVLPVFAEEIITLDIHGRIMEGKILSVDDIKANGVKGSVIMANDSDYTLLFEYVYGNARKNQSVATTVNKTFYLTQTKGSNAESPKKLTPGTRLTLIDVTHGNTPYYYTVSESSPNQISYTDFIGSDGTAYTNYPIKDLADENGAIDADGDPVYTDMEGMTLKHAGVERYLIMVEKPSVYDASNEVYAIHGAEQIDTTLASKMVISNHVDLSVTALPGLTIAFDTAKMKITGSMKKDGTVLENIAVNLTGTDLYWVEKRKGEQTGSSIIDSQNHGKYLELGLYLRDSHNSRVYFLTGTNFRYQINGGEMSSYQSLKDPSVLYFYKEIGQEYKIEQLSANATISVSVEFNFASATLSELTDTSYYAYIDLLRSSNKDYPMGSNNRLDTYNSEIDANPSHELGFAVVADDYLDLGINTYNHQADNPDQTDNIPFTVKFDFQDILDKVTDKNAATDKWSAYEYKVSYSFTKKQKSGNAVDYTGYTGNDLSLYFNETDNTQAVTGTSEGYSVAYTITKDEIRNGTADRKMLLRVNPENMDLSNYKLTATLTVSEPDSVAGTSTTDDFFVFTVTKLKTDL